MCHNVAYSLTARNGSLVLIFWEVVVAERPLPYAPICDSRLSIAARLVYAYLWRRGLGEDWVTISVRGTARALHMSETTVLKVYRTLESDGWPRRRWKTPVRQEGRLRENIIRPK